MTVIVWDGRKLVADGRVSSEDNILTENFNKIFELNVPYLGDVLLAIAVAGVLADAEKIVLLLKAKEFPLMDDCIEHGASCIIVGLLNVYKLDCDAGVLIKYDKKTKLACGSGGVVARTAMSLGCDAVQAAKQAIKLNVFCGGKLTIWDGK